MLLIKAENVLTFLGCGSSRGVPQISQTNPQGDWGTCDARQPKNHRTRSSVYIEYCGLKLLIDTSPDLRTQYLREQLGGVDAVLYTHVHSDHIYGLSELDTLFHSSKQKIDLYTSVYNLDQLKINFPFYFKERDIFNVHTIDREFKIKNVVVIAFEQVHGKEISLGFRFGNLAYSTDFSHIGADQLKYLKNLDTWVVDCTWRNFKSSSHLDLKQAIQWYHRIKPRQMFLTHMNNTLDYQTLCNELPASIRPAYDGLKINFV